MQKLLKKTEKEEKLLYTKNNTIKRMTEDLEVYAFNTAIARSMEFVNEIVLYEQNETLNKKLLMNCIETLIILLAPFAPHFAEELWESIGKTTSVHKEEWPKYNEDEMQLKQIEIPVQINGKVKTVVKVNVNLDDEEIKQTVKENSIIKNVLEGKNIVKEIYVKGKIYNIVCK